jgi:signal transduction histidine kinase
MSGASSNSARISTRDRVTRAVTSGDVSLQSVIDAMPAHLAVLNERGEILLVNKRWTDFATENGGDPSLIGPGVNYLKICDAAADGDADEAGAVAEGIRSVVGGERDSFYIQYPCHSPTEKRWFQVRVSRCPGEGPARVVVTHESITEARLTEQEIRKHQAELAHLLRVSTVSEMAAGLAHELNQPLASIANFASGCRRRLETGALDAKVMTQALDEIAEQAHRAGEIIRRVRHFLRKGEVLKESIDVAQLVDDAVALMAAELREHDITLTSSVSDDVPIVLADGIQIQQVVMNLVRNAVEAIRDHNPPGDPRRVELRVRPTDPGMVRVDVVDSGPGASGDAAVKLFDPFFTTKDAGMGIGLSLCRSIIDAHGGEIWARPNRDRGMNFTFTLPITEPSSDSSSANSSSSKQGADS